MTVSNVGDSPNGMTEAIQKDGRTVLSDRRDSGPD